MDGSCSQRNKQKLDIKGIDKSGVTWHATIVSLGQKDFDILS